MTSKDEGQQQQTQLTPSPGDRPTDSPLTELTDGDATTILVQKRNKKFQPFTFSKIVDRLQGLSKDLEHVSATDVAHKLLDKMHHKMETTELDELAVKTCAYKAAEHIEYNTLASRLCVSNLRKQIAGRVFGVDTARERTRVKFSDTTRTLEHAVDPRTGKSAHILHPTYIEAVHMYADELDAMIDDSRDYLFDFFGMKTLEKSYLLRGTNKLIVESPQHMMMRVAVWIHYDADTKTLNLDNVKDTYDKLSQKEYIHATPTLFNAGTQYPQLSSCFLLTMKDDSIDGIYSTLKACARISKYAGGIGMAIHNVRSTGSIIRGTNGSSNGIVPMLRVFNATASYVDQGGGKRKGAIAAYIEPWHADIEDFLHLRLNNGPQELRTHDLFTALWIPDLFMERVYANEKWSLFSPDTVPDLYDSYGDAFREKYVQYEKEGLQMKTVDAQHIWSLLIASQIQTGTPYMLYKDACNRKSNQKHLGTIRCSNLCTEIMQYTSEDEIAVCNLASVSLSTFVDKTNKQFDFARLRDTVKTVVYNLDKVIEKNFYPCKEAKHSNFRHRPMGIGVQGLADTFHKLAYAFGDDNAQTLNKQIFEHMYYAALCASCELAKQKGPHETFEGSPLSQGKFQFDLWAEEGTLPADFSLDLGQDTWDNLRQDILIHGVRHSLLLAPMPTASTAQILGNNESIEPFTSNLYYRRTLAGEFICPNHHLQTELFTRGLWTKELQESIKANRGSIAHTNLDEDMRRRFRTVWEIPQRHILDMAAARAPFICQSQSLNIHMADPTVPKLSTMHMYAWKLGLKTGQYYLRTLARAKTVQFTVLPSSAEQEQEQEQANQSVKECRWNARQNATTNVDDDDDDEKNTCLMCQG